LAVVKNNLEFVIFGVALIAFIVLCALVAAQAGLPR
jgi:hypothetical protein